MQNAYLAFALLLLRNCTRAKMVCCIFNEPFIYLFDRFFFLHSHLFSECIFTWISTASIHSSVFSLFIFFVSILGLLLVLLLVVMMMIIELCIFLVLITFFFSLSRIFPFHRLFCLLTSHSLYTKKKKKYILHRRVNKCQKS